MSIRVTGLYRYPVKSCRGESLSRAVVEPWGLAGDRRWMLVDESGTRVTAREHPRLVLVTPSIDNSNKNGGVGGEGVGADGGVGGGEGVGGNGGVGGGEGAGGDGGTGGSGGLKGVRGGLNGVGADNSNKIRLEGPGLPELVVPFPRGDGADLVPVTIGGSELLAAWAGEAADEWFTRITGKPVRLVYLDDPTRRATNPAHSEPGDRVSFADGYPLLLVSERSLDQLNDWLSAGRFPEADPLPVSRFRPNVVFTGAPAFAEDAWKRISIGDVPFRVAKLCDRCVLTTIDPETSAKGREPLVTLAKHRRWDGKVWFGVNLIPDLSGGGEPVIRPGDPVRVLS